MTSLALPDDLRDRVLAAARRARAAGRPAAPAPEISPAEAFRRAAETLDGLLGTLSDDDWHRPALRDLDVQCLVGHLTGVELDMQRCLSGDQAVAASDHAGSTRPSAASQAGRIPARTRKQWRDAVDRTLGLLRGRASLSAVVALHGMRLPLSALLVVRAFELWTHDNDIRRAAGRPQVAPDPSAVPLMTDLAARLLDHGAARTGMREPAQLHLVLTGPGGGTWDVPIGDRPCAAPAPVTIVTDAIGFCRLVAGRAAPGDLDLHVTGDDRRASGILAAASALALD